MIHPQKNRSKSDFVSEINENLSSCLELIQQRQEILYENPDHEFDHLTIVIDEVLALSEGVNKVIKESFFSLLSQIALLGRATKIHLLLVSQRFDHNTIPISVREQLNVLIQIGNINKKTTQFLKTFNLNLNLLFFGFIAFLISYGFHVLGNQIKTSSFLSSQSVFADIQTKLQVVDQYTQSIAYLFILIAIILTLTELCQRIMKDSIWNYFKSVYQTL